MFTEVGFVLYIEPWFAKTILACVISFYDKILCL